MKAASMRARYTVANPEGREFKTLSRMWLVPRGKFMFMIRGRVHADFVLRED
jgi:hypothetical protein